jgi:hypothetical protein
MKTYEIKIRRTSYIEVTIEAENKKHAEELAWEENAYRNERNEDASYEVESIEESEVQS